MENEYEIILTPRVDTVKGSSKKLEEDLKKLNPSITLKTILEITDQVIQKHLNSIQKVINSKEPIAIKTKLDGKIDGKVIDTSKMESEALKSSEQLQKIFDDMAKEITGKIANTFDITNSKTIKEINQISTEWLKLSDGFNKFDVEDDLFEKVYDTIKKFDSAINEAQNTYDKFVKHINSSKIKMDPYGDKEQYEQMRRSAGVGVVSSKSGTPMDVFYEDARTQFPFLSDLQNAEDQFEEIIRVLREGRNNLKANTITDEEIESWFGGRNGIRKAVSEILGQVSTAYEEMNNIKIELPQVDVTSVDDIDKGVSVIKDKLEGLSDSGQKIPLDIDNADIAKTIETINTNTDEAIKRVTELNEGIGKTRQVLESVNDVAKELEQNIEKVTGKQTVSEDINQKAVKLLNDSSKNVDNESLSQPYIKAFEALTRLYELKVRYASLVAPSMESADFYKSQISAQEQVYLKSVPKDSTPEFNSEFSNQLILQRIDLENQLNLQMEKTAQTILNKEKVEIEASNNSRQQTIQNLELVENKLIELQNKIMPTGGELLIDDSYRQIADDFTYLFNNLNTLKGDLNIPPDAKQSLDDLLKSYEQLYKVQADLGNVNVDTSGNFDVLKDSVGDAKDEVKSFSSETRQTVGITQTLSDNVANAAAQFFTFQQAISLLQRFVKSSIDFIINMDNALNEVKLTTFKTQEEIEELGKSYIQLGKDMRVSSLEVAQGSVSFYRSGLSDEKVLENLEQAVIYSKIAKVSLNDAVQTIEASVNSLGVSAQRTNDVLNYLGDSTSTSAQEVGDALRKVSGVAGSVGLELEKVGSYIAVISSETREAESSIGDGLKSLFSRMASLKQKGYAEAENGELTSVNDVAKSLNKANIALMDSKNQMRDFGLVLDELSSVWGKLDDTTRKYISTTIGGTYQANRFQSLMKAYPQSLELYEKSLESAGIAQKKYDIYLQSSAASIDKFKATLEGAQQNLLSSDFLKDMINSGTKLMEVLSQVAGFLNSPVGTGTMAFFLTSVNVATTNTPYVQKCA